MKNNTTLINSLLSTYNINTYLKNIALVLFGTLLLALSSKVQVPFWPVPMTMQTFIVFIIGMAYGWRLAFFTLVAYLLEGALGLPVFAKGGGLLYLTGPTAGYLYGMTIAAAVRISRILPRCIGPDGVIPDDMTCSLPDCNNFSATTSAQCISFLPV